MSRGQETRACHGNQLPPDEKSEPLVAQLEQGPGDDLAKWSLQFWALLLWSSWPFQSVTQPHFKYGIYE